MKRGSIFFITGPTGSGKTVISDYILQHRKDTVRAISYTTRKKRETEINNKDYFFITKKELKKMIKENKLIEYSEVYGNLYGTSVESFNPVKKGYDVIKVLDVQGAKKFKYSKINAKYFFFCPKDKKVLDKRLTERGDKDKEKRLSFYEEEIKFQKEANYQIDTSGTTEEDIESCAKEVIGIMDILRNS